MSNVLIEIVRAFAPIVGVIVGALLGSFVKSQKYKHQVRQEYDKSWLTQKQSRWSPLLGATRELKGRFENLSKIYSGETNNPSISQDLWRDFCELYLLLDEKEINVFKQTYDFQKNYWQQFSGRDLHTPRACDDLVQHVRMRAYSDLTFAESSLYKTVEYLGNAERVRRDLYEDRLILPEAAQEEMGRLILKVRASLQGNSGAGIFQEQQEYIGETVWSTADRVIANYEYLNKLFNLQSWEQFTSLFLFFVNFQFKLDVEIKDTISDLGKLEEKVNQLTSCQSRKEYEALWTRGTFM